MSKKLNKELITKCIDYIKRFLGQEIRIVPSSSDKVKVIPLAVRANYDFFEGELLGQEVSFILAKDYDEFTPGQINKHQKLISNQLDRTAIMVFDSLALYNMNRLMSKKVNFIVPYKQAFMPELLVAVHKQPAISQEIKVIPPFAQVILLWQLLRGGLEGLDTRTIACRIGITQATAYRSMNWLAKKDLVKMIGEKEKIVRFCAEGKALWDEAAKVCISPIEKIVYTDDNIEGIKTNIEALSEMTMMNNDGRHYIAMTRDELKATKALVDTKYGDNCVEVWRYDPKILAKDGVSDPLSLYLSLRDNEDDRIQIELEHLIEKLW
ncbi:MAG: hypothetical protein HUK15_07345 [Bacteroidales bacterium]|nr:hypothetical protein [Bacteroidales bacterium]